MRQVLIFTTLLFLSTNFLLAQTRDCDPVVLLGADVSCMLGTAPTDIVGFRYVDGQWQQIPIQIDERIFMDILTPYPDANCKLSAQDDYLWEVYFYADPNTFIGPDNVNPDFDADDEFVFMNKDVGVQAPNNSCPSNVLPNSRCRIEVLDPVFSNQQLGYIYIFEQDGSLAQDAGMDYVDYDYDDFNGSYKDNYIICFNGEQDINLEDSRVTTDNYTMHFSRRWENDELAITAGSASGVNILDSHQYFTSFGSCNRTEVTFSQRRGPIIANIDGPIRGIRSVMGAHSGTYMQLDLKFTECRVINDFYYRIHPSIGFYEARDLNANAIGMNFYSDRNPSGTIIDGSRDDDNFNTVEPSQWELTEGVHGSLVTTYTYDTDMIIGTETEYDQFLADGFVESYYDDRGIEDIRKCTGDLSTYGASGFHLRSRVCTDRLRDWDDNPSCVPDSVKFFEAKRFNYFLPPQITTGEAIRYADFAKSPLIANITSQTCNTVLPTCDDGTQNGNETGIDCGGSCPPCPPTCDDGIQNGNETDIDCGGSCPPCSPTCDDGIQNGNETDIDCGGSCTPCNTSCPDLNLSSNFPSSSGVYVYDDYRTIQCSSQQRFNTDVTFIAQDYILLLPGFESDGDKMIFEARIEPCSSNTESEIDSRTNVNHSFEWELYPNPAQHQLNITFTLPTESTVTIQVFNSAGKLVYLQNNATVFSDGKHDILLPTSQWTNGLYWIQIQTNTTTQISKILVNH